MQELIKSNKKNRINNLCSTGSRFIAYHWKLLYTVLEFKALTLQKNYRVQLQLVHGGAVVNPTSTGRKSPSKLGSEKVCGQSLYKKLS